MLLGLDLGTTNVKALVTSTSGQVLGQGSSPVRLFHVESGRVEQDLEEIWTATLSAIRQAVRPVNPRDIRCMGVSSQGGALQLLDGQRSPTGRIISWLDQRGRPNDAALTTELGQEWFAQRIGHGGAGVAIGQLARLRGEAPSSLAPPNRIGFVGDCIVARLCGHAAHDGTSCGLTLLYNPATFSYDPDVLARLQIGSEQLPDLISPRTVAGGLLEEVSRLTGLRAGIPVSAAIHDQYTAALGTGAVRAGTTMLGAGTAWVLLAVHGHPAQAVSPGAFVNRHVVQGLYGQIVSLVNGGSALAWASELMGLGAKAVGEVELLLDSAPAGSEGLCFWPFLAPVGAAGLAPGKRGCLSGLRLAHGRAHLLRAVVEGLGFELKRHLLLFQKAGIPVEKLTMGGTAAASQITPQILADITGLPLACQGADAGSLLGACIIARGLQEPHRSLADLAEEMVPSPRRVEPGKDMQIYPARFHEYMAALESV